MSASGSTKKPRAFLKLRATRNKWVKEKREKTSQHGREPAKACSRLKA